jgi:5-methylcytosine-specific restriction endonuclease McrA
MGKMEYMRNEKGQFIKGNESCWKGKKRPEMIGNKYCLGRVCPQETRDLISRVLIEKGIEPKVKFVGFGINHPRWKGGESSISHLIRGSARYYLWCKTVFDRDNWTCQKCGDNISGKLNTHHIKNFSKILEENNIKKSEDAIKCQELWDINNGITFCKECHWKFHKKYSTKNNNQEQVNEFLNTCV